MTTSAIQARTKFRAPEADLRAYRVWRDDPSALVEVRTSEVITHATGHMFVTEALDSEYRVA